MASLPVSTAGYALPNASSIAAPQSFQRPYSRLRCTEAALRAVLKGRAHPAVRAYGHQLQAWGYSRQAIRMRTGVIAERIGACQRQEIDHFDLRSHGNLSRRTVQRMSRELEQVYSEKGRPHFKVLGSTIIFYVLWPSATAELEGRLKNTRYQAAKRARVRRKNASEAGRAARQAYRHRTLDERAELVDELAFALVRKTAPTTRKIKAHMAQSGASGRRPPPALTAPETQISPVSTGYTHYLSDKREPAPQPPSIPDHINNFSSPKGASATALVSDQPKTSQPTPIERGTPVPLAQESKLCGEPPAQLAASGDAFGEEKKNVCLEGKKEKAASWQAHRRADWIEPDELNAMAAEAAPIWALYTGRDQRARLRVVKSLRKTYGVPLAEPPVTPATERDKTQAAVAQGEAFLATFGLTKERCTKNAPAFDPVAYKPGHLLVEAGDKTEYLPWAQLDREGIGSHLIAFAAYHLTRKLREPGGGRRVGNRAGWLLSRARVYARDGVMDHGLLPNPHPFDCDEMAAASLAPKHDLYHGAAGRRWR